MPAECLIVGQGIAGSLLALELSRNKVSFEVADPGFEGSASALAAGMINPVTGMRFVKSWEFDRLMPIAQAAYEQAEVELGVRLWSPMRIRRLFRTAAERVQFERKRETPEIAAYVGPADGDGFWIEGGARVDMRALLSAVRGMLQGSGRLRAERVDLALERRRYPVVIDCRGKDLARPGGLPGLRWEVSRGQALTLAVRGLDPYVILNRGHWVLPCGEGLATCGATHEPDISDPIPTQAGRDLLEAAARVILGRDFSVTGQAAAIRAGLPDRRPVAGRHVSDPSWGVLGALGNKGVLWAPSLAREWFNHLTEGIGFSREVRIERASVRAA